MGDWIDFDRWPECVEMERPGIVFELAHDVVRESQGQVGDVLLAGEALLRTAALDL